MSAWLDAIDELLAEPLPLQVPRATFCGVQRLDGFNLLLMNFGDNTRAIVWYDNDDPVQISEAS